MHLPNAGLLGRLYDFVFDIQRRGISEVTPCRYEDRVGLLRKEDSVLHTRVESSNTVRGFVESTHRTRMGRQPGCCAYKARCAGVLSFDSEWNEPAGLGCLVAFSASTTGLMLLYYCFTRPKNNLFLREEAKRPYLVLLFSERYERL